MTSLLKEVQDFIISPWHFPFTRSVPAAQDTEGSTHSWEPCLFLHVCPGEQALGYAHSSTSGKHTRQPQENMNYHSQVTVKKEKGQKFLGAGVVKRECLVEQDGIKKWTLQDCKITSVQESRPCLEKYKALLT